MHFGRDKDGLHVLKSNAILLICLFVCSSVIAQQSPPSKRSKESRTIKIVDCFGYDWPKQEVSSIITDEERAAFCTLKNDEERDQFIEQFWIRRDPSPDTYEKEFRDEYYKRLVYANEHFASKGMPGWRSDRGLLYSKYGPPDSIEEGVEEGHRTLRWQYRYMDGVGKGIDPNFVNGVRQGIVINFVDVDGTGDYRYRIPQNEKDLLLQAPEYSKVSRSDSHFDAEKLIAYIGPTHSRSIRFRDLEEIISHKVTFTSVPFYVGVTFKPVTKRTVQIPIKLTFRSSQLKWAEKNGKSTAHVQVFGRLIRLTGRIDQILEDEVTFEQPPAPDSDISLTHTIYIFEGNYRLDLVVKDVNGDLVGTKTFGIKARGKDRCESSN